MAKRLENFDLEGISYLESAKNLLGFSAQVDSTCLFYVLLNLGIDFDIAIIDYQIREDSKLEVAHAKNLAKKYNKKIFDIKSPKFNSNFEANARTFRIDFFKKIIKSHNYKNLILANHLNDRLEWFLMQFTKGCALNSLLGFDAISKLDDFNIIRPFFNTSKRQILEFLYTNNIKYFIDKSNDDEMYLRNYFRKNFSNHLMEKYENGIKKSLNLLKNEYEILYGQTKIHNLNDNIYFFTKKENHINLHNIDICAKKLGYVISSKQRDEIVKSNYSCITASKIVIDNNSFDIYVAKNDIRYKHSKKIRESFRIRGIPPKIRPLIESIL
ncbi:tRNA lysidine(34) synthetase TilS [Helicobacter sp. MIT 99-5507]|uniref:tRNA lysidine(34) synthetase TilS n=1 Tax=Helicobacter sp. MIT 99-5507 TaxID=152489 RepID=UPI0015F143BC|nr:tRNA lysidine(34) synthetase TilS [Helicobacter sp. MIT 99-5507]